MEHKPNEREGCYEKENVVFCFLTLIIAMNFLEISIPFINTTNEVLAVPGRAFYWNPAPCAECKSCPNCFCDRNMLPDWLPEC